MSVPAGKNPKVVVVEMLESLGRSNGDDERAAPARVRKLIASVSYLASHPWRGWVTAGGTARV